MSSHNTPRYPASHPENDRIANLECHKSQMRKCHDCGEPTTDYRCRACLAKWRSKHHVSSVVSDAEE